MGSALLGALLTLACAAHAAGQAESKRAAALNWVRGAGAETCLDAATLALGVETRLGRAVFPAPSQAELIVEGSVQPSSTGFSATLRMFDREGKALGSRELSSPKPDCGELSETVILVLAVMVDPDATWADTAPTRDSQPPPPPPPPPPREPQLAAPVRSARVRSKDVGAFARLEFGTLPEPALGVGLFAIRSFAPLLTFRIEGAGFFDSTRTLDGVENRGARFWLLYGALLYCPLDKQLARFRFLGCAGPSVGAMLSRSFGLDPRENDHTDLTVHVVGQVRADVTIFGPMRAFAGAGAGALLVRTLYEFTDTRGVTRELFEPDALLANFDLGLSASF